MIFDIVEMGKKVHYKRVINAKKEGERLTKMVKKTECNEAFCRQNLIYFLTARTFFCSTIESDPDKNQLST